jgi:hypothetical protein
MHEGQQGLSAFDRGASMPKDSDQYSVVALGAMNPRIHHPKWYELVKIFSADAVNAAIKTEPVICTPAISQCKIGDITIKCLPERWDIQTANRQEIDRIREIAQEIFDKVLGHTPVNVVALNFDYVRETNDEGTRSVAAVLSEAATRLGLGEVDGGDLILKRRVDSTEQFERTATVALRSTDDPHTFIIACNYNYAIKGMGPWQMVDFLPEYARKDQSHAESSLRSIIASLGHRD